MSKSPTSLSLPAGLAAAAVVALVGCGDPITANHDWYAVASLAVSVDNVSPGFSTLTRVLDGRLLDQMHGTAVPGTLVHEICVTYVKDGQMLPSNCRIFLNSGSQDYVAINPSTNPANPVMFTDAPPDGRLVVTTVGSEGKDVVLKISAVTGLS